MFTTFHASNWHPLTWLSHAIDYAIWGLNPVGHHLTSILLHGINTFLVVILIMRLINYAKYKALSPTHPIKGDEHTPFPSREGIKGCVLSRGETHPCTPLKRGLSPIITGVVTGLLFGLHPLHVESVAWVSERKDVLYAFFFLLSILSYLKYASSLQKQEPSGHSSPVTRHWWYSLCLLFFILSLMSKPMAVTLPVVLLILDSYPLGRLKMRGMFTAHRGVLIEKLPFIGLSLASSVITIMAQQKAIVPLDSHPLGERVLIAFHALGFYLFKMLWPIGLYPYYPYPARASFFTVEYMGAFIVAAGITVLCVWLWRKRKVFLSAWLYYVVTLLPVLGIIQVGEQAAADRYTYLPGLGLFLLAGLGVALIYERVGSKGLSPGKGMLFLISVLILSISILSALTVKQTAIWKSSLALWNRETGEFRNFYLGYRGRGEAYVNSGNYQMAIDDFSRAIELNMADAISYYGRGLAYGKSGDNYNAIRDFKLAIELDPGRDRFYNDIGVAYANLGSYAEAVQNFDKAIGLNPFFARAYFHRGAAYKFMGLHQQAVRDLQTAAQLGSGEALNYLKKIENQM